MLLLLKLVLVPSLIAAVTLAARRWGPRVGGILVGLPVVAGPTLCFYVVEQGAPFAAEAARGATLAVVAVLAFAVAYAWASEWRWAVSLVAGYAAWGVATIGLAMLRLGPWVLPVVLTACVVSQRVLPASRRLPPAAPPPAWDLPMRMGAALALVLTLTSVAAWLGPTWSGLLTPFPVATAVVSAFTHAQRGSEAARAFFRGFVPAMATFAVFCFVLSVTVARAPLWQALGLAVLAQLALQIILLWTTRARLSTMGRAHRA